jgi:cytochrome b involved in lipid metabolism
MKNHAFSYLTGCLLLTIIVTGCATTSSTSDGTTSQNQNTNQSTATDSTTKGKTYSLSDVQSHNSESDCWTVVENRVYEVTDYIPKHNPKILDGCGKDATSIFLPKHSQKAKDTLNKYYIGDLAQ